ncbi:hypothetical protein F8388_025888 [Cannabis sativa]|uniref:Uncharacterized protein n=1 Tax=Cannabis sativa TaxID=3483 RepID=A0A7J6FCI2_CANSA|nr:hypothetical protein F8388_025888 [Cannabis sativa]
MEFIKSPTIKASSSLKSSSTRYECPDSNDESVSTRDQTLAEFGKDLEPAAKVDPKAAVQEAGFRGSYGCYCVNDIYWDQCSRAKDTIVKQVKINVEN